MLSEGNKRETLPVNSTTAACEYSCP